MIIFELYLIFKQKNINEIMKDVLKRYVLAQNWKKSKRESERLSLKCIPKFTR